jgi:hypothetical protein
MFLTGTSLAHHSYHYSLSFGVLSALFLSVIRFNLQRGCTNALKSHKGKRKEFTLSELFQNGNDQK